MTHSLVATASNTANLTEYTFSGLAFGAAASDRHIIVCGYSRVGSGDVLTVASVTIGGVAASVYQHSQPNPGGSSSASNVSFEAIAAVPTGATGDVVVTFSRGTLRAHVQVYRTTNLVSATPYDVQVINSSTDSAMEVQLDIPAGGFAIATGSSTSKSFTWVGLTKDHEESVEASAGTSASDEFATAQTGRTISVDGTVMVAASWGVASGGGETITSDTGSFILAGQAAFLINNWQVVADTGSFALAGQDLGLVSGYVLSLDNGSLSLSGQTATFVNNARITAESGTFSLVGQDTSLDTAAEGIVEAEAGSFSLAGQAASLRSDSKITASSGMFDVGGQDALLAVGSTITASPGVFTLTGFETDLVTANEGVFTLSTGTFTLTGQAASLESSSQEVVHGSLVFLVPSGNVIISI